MNTVNQSVMPATARVNEKNHLEIGGCDCVELARRFGTPLYVMDEETLRTSCRQYKNAFASYPDTTMLFAAKAFMTAAMCCVLREEDFGLDVVSGGEIHTARKADFPMSRVFFNGNNKTADELELALSVGIGRITVDNFSELTLLQAVAEKAGQDVDILLRITPGIECHTHEYIQTGQIDCKFGFDMTQLAEAVQLIKEKYHRLNLKGLHAHIGSQIFETNVYGDLVEILVKEMAFVREKFGLNLTEMNIGGGLGIRYIDSDDPPSIDDIAQVIITALKDAVKKYDFPEPQLILEPGRSITGTAGVTLYTVGGEKQVPGATKYVMVDGGMADNPRPSMYQAKYHAVVANKAMSNSRETVTVAGRYCESGDVLIHGISLPHTEPGDIICVFNTGAYNYSMASNYNRVPRPAAVLVNKGQADIFIRRESYADMTSLDVIPERLMCRK